jgi:hypothetical protein
MNLSAYCSYLIRMARVAAPGHDDAWRIVVKHIQSGEEYRFDGVDGLLNWLREEATSLQSFSDPNVE